MPDRPVGVLGSATEARPSTESADGPSLTGDVNGAAAAGWAKADADDANAARLRQWMSIGVIVLCMPLAAA